MGDGGAVAIRTLRKREVERLLTEYDADPVAALSVALRIILDLPDADWPALVTAAPFDATRQRLLLDVDQASLDALAGDLNETRTLPQPP